MEMVLKFWKMRNLTIEGKSSAFKSLTISRIVYIVLVKNVLIEIISELNSSCSYPKIKHTTLCKNYFLKEMFFHLSIGISSYTGNSILSEILKNPPAFCLNIYGTIQTAR